VCALSIKVGLFSLQVLGHPSPIQIYRPFPKSIKATLSKVPPRVCHLPPPCIAAVSIPGEPEELLLPLGGCRACVGGHRACDRGDGDEGVRAGLEVHVALVGAAHGAEVGAGVADVAEAAARGDALADHSLAGVGAGVAVGSLLQTLVLGGLCQHELPSYGKGG